MSYAPMVPQYQGYTQQPSAAPIIDFDEDDYYDDDEDDLDGVANPMDAFNQNNDDDEDDDPNNPFNDEDDEDDDEDDDIAGIIANTAALGKSVAPPPNLFNNVAGRSPIPTNGLFQPRAPLPPVMSPAQIQPRGPVPMIQPRGPVPMIQRTVIPPAIVAVAKPSAPRLVVLNAPVRPTPNVVQPGTVTTPLPDVLNRLPGAVATPLPGAGPAAPLPVPIPTLSQTAHQERQAAQLLNIEQLLTKMPGIYTTSPLGVVVTDINDLLKQNVDESPEDFEARRRLTLQLAAIPDYQLNPVSAATIGQMMMKKARQGVTYDVDMENALTYITGLLQR